MPSAYWPLATVAPVVGDDGDDDGGGNRRLGTDVRLGQDVVL